MYVFLSHSSIDADVANGLCQELEKNGIGCFLAPRDIRSGYEYAEEIIYGIDKSDAMVLILSNNSNQSPHVLREVERAVSKNVPIIVYRIEDVILTKSMEYFLMSHQWLNGKVDGYQDMVNAVKNLANRQSNEIENELKPVKEKGMNNKNKIIVGGVVTIVAIAVGMGFFLASIFDKNDSNMSNQKNTTAISDTQDKDNGNVNTDKKPKQVELGDTVKFGTYNGVPIYWRVIKISDDKSEAMLVASDIITMKAFDAADSERFCMHEGEMYYVNRETKADTDMEFQAFIRGNSEWATSDIRAWLNCEKGVADYGESAPMNIKMSDKNNGYDLEAGFLTNFSEEELAAIKTTVLETKGNVLSDEEVITTEDKVYLLTIEDLQLLKDASIGIYAKPTDECLEKDMSNWYDEEKEYNGTVMHYWWLRDPVDESSSKCPLVSNEYWDGKIIEKEVGLEGYGIRPAITVDLTSDAIVIED